MVRLILSALALLATATAARAAATSVAFTHVPAFGQSADKTLSGSIHSLDSANVRVIVYIQVGGAWWPKPSSAKPLTTIAADGSWSANIAPVASDTKATAIAAFVVPLDFTPPAAPAGGEPWIPDLVNAAALASTDTIRLDAATRSFHWSGFDWLVRDSTGERQGPGDNLFSPSTDNVFVDADGLLHLRITGAGGNQRLTLTFPRKGYAPGLSYVVQSSADLVTWTDLQTAAPGYPRTITFTDSVAINSASRRFLRLRVTAAP